MHSKYPNTQTVQIHYLFDQFQLILTPDIVYLYFISLGGRSGVHVPNPLLKKPLCSVWCTGALVYWCTGVLVRWCAVHWLVRWWVHWCELWKAPGPTAVHSTRGWTRALQESCTVHWTEEGVKMENQKKTLTSRTPKTNPNKIVVPSLCLLWAQAHCFCVCLFMCVCKVCAKVHKLVTKTR